MKRSYLSQFTNHLDQTSLENKEFIIWTLMNLPWLRDRFFLRGTARKTVQVRYGHPARSGSQSPSQSQRRIWFILPAHGASQSCNKTIYSMLRARKGNENKIWLLRFIFERTVAKISCCVEQKLRYSSTLVHLSQDWWVQFELFV